MRGDSKGEFVPGKKDTGAFFLREDEMLLELRQGRDAIFHLPFPVVPLLGSGFGPIAGSVGNEFLIG